MRWINLEKYPFMRRLLVLSAFVVLGVIGYLLLQYSSTPPKRRPPSARGRPVRVLEAKSLKAVPRATGYGIVTAQQEWQAIAQVSGAIIEMDENVEVGRVVREGTVLFKVDPGSYELEQNRTKATVQAVQAQVGELKAREKSARATLDVEKRALALAQKDFDRVQSLYNNGLTSSAELDSAEKGLLTAEKAVRQLENTIRELPASRKVLEAQLAQQKTGVEGAKMDLARTEIVAPFTMRIQQLNAGIHQVVNSGQVVLVGAGIDVMEVPAQFPVGTLGPLLGRRNQPTPPTDQAASASRDMDTSAEAAASNAEDDDAKPAKGETAADAPPASPEATGRPRRGQRRTSSIQALVRLKSHGVERTWKGTFRRFEGVDSATRTMGVVVEVAEPRQRGNGAGPPLLPGLYVEVELRGAERSDCLAIPRAALHKNIVYVVGQRNRLALRTVDTDLVQEQFVCVVSGLKAGEQIVLTELAPAVEGTQLIPRLDDTAADRLAAMVRGEASEP